MVVGVEALSHWVSGGVIGIFNFFYLGIDIRNPVYYIIGTNNGWRRYGGDG